MKNKIMRTTQKNPKKMGKKINLKTENKVSKHD